MDMMMQRDERHGLRLYVKRVFIMDAAEQLLPHYLRFMRGVVDSDDLPLNISRELLQENKLVGKIRSAVIRRSLDLLQRLADKDIEKFNNFWDEFGNVVKEGRVKPYLAGTLTEAKFYETEVSSTSPNNFVESDSVGFFSFFVDEADYSADQPVRPWP